MQNAWETKATEQIKEIYAEGTDVTRQNVVINAKKNHDMALTLALLTLQEKKCIK
jgi:hypothetical protein